MAEMDYQTALEATRAYRQLWRTLYDLQLMDEADSAHKASMRWWQKFLCLAEEENGEAARFNAAVFGGIKSNG